MVWYCLKRQNVPEVSINIIKDMYKDRITLVSITVGETGEIEIKIGLDQGSALIRLLSIIIMDVITEDIEEEKPWAMLFAGEIPLFGERYNQKERRLELRRTSLEDVGLKLSRKLNSYRHPEDKRTSSQTSTITANMLNFHYALAMNSLVPPYIKMQAAKKRSN